eukprot:gene931-1807_t
MLCEMTPLQGKSPCIEYSPINEVSNESPSSSFAPSHNITGKRKWTVYSQVLFVWLALFSVGCLFISNFSNNSKDSTTVKNNNYRTVNTGIFDFPPLSKSSPMDIVPGIDRPVETQPGYQFGNLQAPIGTNLWSENLFLGTEKSDQATTAYQIPYIIDTIGPITGLRTHSPEFYSTGHSFFMDYDRKNGITVGAVEEFFNETIVIKDGSKFTSLAVEVEWKSKNPGEITSMRSPIVRGSPYITMKYINATPHIYVQRPLAYESPVIYDQGINKKKFKCGIGAGNFSESPILVQKEMIMEFDVSDQLWMIFISKPTYFVCSIPPWPQQGSFQLKATKPMEYGVIRVALAYTCSKALNPVKCNHTHRSIEQMDDMKNLLRTHAVAVPTARADVAFSNSNDNDVNSMNIVIKWEPESLYNNNNNNNNNINNNQNTLKSNNHKNHNKIRTSTSTSTTEDLKPLILALPHHQKIFNRTLSNKIINIGCVVTLHGEACPIADAIWNLQESLPIISFHADRPIRDEILPLIKSSISDDLHYNIQDIYARGVGDTYFSGKELAKLARIIIIANELGYTLDNIDFQNALNRLKKGIEIWIENKGENIFVYDKIWGGYITCGCSPVPWNLKTNHCDNKFPNCPSVYDQQNNYGNGYYNDHHYHYGYFIYTAATIIKFDVNWGRKFHPHMLLFIRDIANPSHEDPFFPTWRHKDWYLGSSWASGIITLLGTPLPFPMGRNQESTAEAVAAYEAIALYGEMAMKIYEKNDNTHDNSPNSYSSSTQGIQKDEDSVLYEQCKNIYKIGRILLATEIQSAEEYWHVKTPLLPNEKRIYPATYKHKVIGRMWSEMAEMNTFFGNEPWKSYGIQLLPLTPIAEPRDDIRWLGQMYPEFYQTCSQDSKCNSTGWSILLYTTQASLCQWKNATTSLLNINSAVFYDYGGNGHSLSNSLWWVGTRPCM